MLLLRLRRRFCQRYAAATLTMQKRMRNRAAPAVAMTPTAMPAFAPVERLSVPDPALAAVAELEAFAEAETARVCEVTPGLVGWTFGVRVVPEEAAGAIERELAIPATATVEAVARADDEEEVAAMTPAMTSALLEKSADGVDSAAAGASLQAWDRGSWVGAGAHSCDDEGSGTHTLSDWGKAFQPLSEDGVGAGGSEEGVQSGTGSMVGLGSGVDGAALDVSWAHGVGQPNAPWLRVRSRGWGGRGARVLARGTRVVLVLRRCRRRLVCPLLCLSLGQLAGLFRGSAVHIDDVTRGRGDVGDAGGWGIVLVVGRRGIVVARAWGG